MNRFMIAAAALAMTAGAAFAADLPSSKAPPLPPPAPPPPPLWTGFYAGLNAGYGFGTNSSTQSLSADEIAFDSAQYTNNPALLGQPILIPTGVGWALSGIGPQNQSGFIGGGQVGYNYQYGSNILFGIEADIQGSVFRGSSHSIGSGLGYGEDAGPVPPPNGDLYTSSFSSIGGTQVNAGVDWLGTVRGRLGYIWTPTFLVYATGGLTYGGVHANVRNFAVTNNSWTDFGTDDGLSQGAVTKNYFGGGSKSQTLVGWNIGGGLEWMFLPNWSLKVEGIYWNLGNINVPTASFAGAPIPDGSPIWESTSSTIFGATRVNYQGVIARAGVNYHFNWGAPAPVVAKY